MKKIKEKMEAKQVLSSYKEVKGPAIKKTKAEQKTKIRKYTE